MAKRSPVQANDNDRNGDPLLSGSKRWGFTFPDAIEKRDRGYASVYGFMLQTYAKLGLKHTEFLLLLHLAWYRYESDASRGIEPSLDTISKLMGYKDKNHRKVSDMVNSLAGRGFIAIEARKGKTSRYDVTPFTRRALDAFIALQNDRGDDTPVEKCGGEGATYTPIVSDTPVQSDITSVYTPAQSHATAPVQLHTTPPHNYTVEEEKPIEIKKSEAGATSAGPLDVRREEPPVISSETSPAPALVAPAPVSTMDRLQAAKDRLAYFGGLEPSTRDELIAALRDVLGSEWADPKFDKHINDIVDVLVEQRYRAKWVAKLAKWCKEHDYKTRKGGFKPWFLADYARERGGELSNSEWREIGMYANSARDDVTRFERELAPRKPSINYAQECGRALTIDELHFAYSEVGKMSADEIAAELHAGKYDGMIDIYRQIAEITYRYKAGEPFAPAPVTSSDDYTDFIAMLDSTSPIPVDYNAMSDEEFKRKIMRVPASTVLRRYHEGVYDDLGFEKRIILENWLGHFVQASATN